MAANSSYLGIMLLDDVSLCIACRGQLREHDAPRIAKILDIADRDSELVGQLPFNRDCALHFRRTPTHTLLVLKKTDVGHIPIGADTQNGVHHANTSQTYS